MDIYIRGYTHGLPMAYM